MIFTYPNMVTQHKTHQPMFEGPCIVNLSHMLGHGSPATRPQPHVPSHTVARH